jgi:DMSO reductase anchor subunit
MHPAFSVIVFTTASGAGYGLLFVLSVLGPLGLLPPEPWLGGVGLGLAFALVTLGLVSSTFHLGRPERAWRAFSQWRSSWLSREAVLAAFTYLPMLVLAAGWVLEGRILLPAALLAALGAAGTVFATGMVYASLKPIARWYNPWVPACYLALALATGALWTAAVAPASSWLAACAALITALAWAMKLAYWRETDPKPCAATAESATGLGRFGTVRLLEPPHTQSNYLLDEMGYRVARKHASRLRRIALGAGLLAPAALVLLAAVAGGIPGRVLLVLAALSGTLGALVERWLFFAEARHTITLYYGDWRPRA